MSDGVVTVQQNSEDTLKGFDRVPVETALKGHSRANKREVSARVEQVRRMLLGGASYGVVRRKIASEWRVSQRHAERYIGLAKRRIQQDVVENRQEIFAEHVASRRLLRNSAYRTDKYGKQTLESVRAQHAILMDEAKLWGLYAPEWKSRDEWKNELSNLGVDLAPVMEMLVVTLSRQLVAGKTPDLGVVDGGLPALSLSPSLPVGEERSDPS